jgi:hypothetical protein
MIPKRVLRGRPKVAIESSWFLSGIDLMLLRISGPQVLVSELG